MDTPKYDHDCKKCVFLGNFTDDEIDYDLYVCSHEFPFIDTLIGRYSSDGPDYCSGVYFIKTIAPIGEAYKRSLEKGYILKKMDTGVLNENL